MNLFIDETNLLVRYVISDNKFSHKLSLIRHEESVHGRNLHGRHVKTKTQGTEEKNYL